MRRRRSGGRLNDLVGRQQCEHVLEVGSAGSCLGWLVCRHGLKSAGIVRRSFKLFGWSIGGSGLGFY